MQVWMKYQTFLLRNVRKIFKMPSADSFALYAYRLAKRTGKENNIMSNKIDFPCSWKS